MTLDPAERTVDMHVKSKQGTDLAVTIRPITHLQVLGLCEKLGITDFHQVSSWPPSLQAIRFFVDVAGLALPVMKTFHEAFQTASELIGPPLKTIVDAVGGFIKALHDAFEGFYNWLVGGSLWPDLMDSLISQTEAGMAGVLQAFQAGFGGITLAAPTIPELTIPELTAAMNITGAQAARASPTQTAPTPALSHLASVTLPITINNQIDGATVSRVIERRLIANRQLSAWRSA